MGSPKLRWGILGTADIARKNWKAIWHSGKGRVSAVASRDLERSRRFIAECQAEAGFEPVPQPLGSYEELIAHDQIDAVYVPLPTGVRKQWVIRAAEAGKHVVCEKPCATSVADLHEMLKACRRSKVQFMDGVMLMHSRRLERMREALDDGQSIGAVRRIESAFTWGQPDEFFLSNIRARSELEPDGCLGDLGWYCIRFALWAMNWRLPLEVTGRTLAEYQHKNSKRPVPIEFSGELFFAEGASSSFYCSFITHIEQWASISGTRGHLWVQDFVLPFSGSELGFQTENPAFHVTGCDFEMQPRIRRQVVHEHSHSHPTAQETNLFRNFAGQIQTGTLDPAWPEMALKTQAVLQACRESALNAGQSVEISEI